MEKKKNRKKDEIKKKLKGGQLHFQIIFFNEWTLIFSTLSYHYSSIVYKVFPPFFFELLFFYHFTLIFINAPYNFLPWFCLKTLLKTVFVCVTLSFHIHNVEIVYINDVVFVNNIVRCRMKIFFYGIGFWNVLALDRRWYIFLIS